MAEDKQLYTAKNGEKYERYRGNVYITLQDPGKFMQGVDIGLLRPALDGKKQRMQVLAYVIRRGGEWSIGGERNEGLTLEQVVRTILESRFSPEDVEMNLQ